ncbi:MAG: sigma-70 family RNA polymerase sigma factor [Dermatophilaceae bacterium]
MADTTTTVLMERAQRGDDTAWSEIQSRYGGLVRRVVRDCGILDAHTGDVVQTTWLRLVEHVQDVQDPQRLGSWLATVARREAWHTSAIVAREVCHEHDVLDRLDGTATPGPEGQTLDHDERGRLRQAVAALPPRQRHLLTLLMQDPVPSYDEISRLTGMTIGSIGPTRARAIERLRRGFTGAETATRPERPERPVEKRNTREPGQPPEASAAHPGRPSSNGRQSLTGTTGTTRARTDAVVGIDLVAQSDCRPTARRRDGTSRAATHRRGVCRELPKLLKPAAPFPQPEPSRERLRRSGDVSSIIERPLTEAVAV